MQFKKIFIKNNIKVVINENSYLDDNSKNRYENIIDIIGLNINIDYPINILLDGIIQLHTTGYSGKPVKFNNNNLSKKLECLLFDKPYIGKNHTYAEIKRRLISAYKYYKFNTVINNKFLNNNSKTYNLPNLGFNFEYSRWIPLQSYEIE